MNKNEIGFKPSPEVLEAIDQRCATVPIGKLQSACKTALVALEIKVKDHRNYLVEILGDAIEMKQNAPSIVVKKEVLKTLGNDEKPNKSD